jgi:glycosyltransferase involved in cell wall biosynthesis
MNRLGGRPACRIVPLEAANTVGEDLPLPEEVRGLLEDAAIDGHVVLACQPADSQEAIAAEAASAAFVWQPSPFDDGRLVVAEAARSGAGCLVADSPPNREIAAWLGSHGLAAGLAWADPADPVSIADALAAGVVRPASPSGNAADAIYAADAINAADAHAIHDASWAAVEKLL